MIQYCIIHWSPGSSIACNTGALGAADEKCAGLDIDLRFSKKVNDDHSNSAHDIMQLHKQARCFIKEFRDVNISDEGRGRDLRCTRQCIVLDANPAYIGT